jgi:hypothetical protein
VPATAGGIAIACILSSAPARGDELPALPAPPVTTAPAAAPTTPPASQGPDIIFLKNGGVVRGTIVEAVPDRTARIQLVTGEIWSIAWTYVDHVVTGASAAAAPAPAPPVPSGPMVQLHVDSPRNVEIIGHPGGNAEWIPMCTGACDKAVPAGWEYQARGADLRASSPFVLKAAPGGTATVHVDPGSKSSFTLGIVGVCVGGPISLVGLMVTAIGASGHITQTVNGVTTTQPVSPSTLPVGLGILGVGVAVVVAGGIVALDNASTSVTQSAARAAQAPAPPPRFIDARLDAPRLPDVATSTIVDLRF